MDLALLFILAGALVRLVFATLFSNDEWTSFFRISLQKGHKSFKYRSDDNLLDGIHGYPMLNFFVISKFPEKYWGRIGRALNVLYDSIAALLVYVWTSSFAVAAGEKAMVAGLSVAQVATLIFVTSPILMPTTGRLRGIKARSLALPVFLTYTLLLNLYFESDGFGWLAASMVLVLVMLHASMFGLQALIFATIALGLWYRDPLPFTSALLVLTLASIIPFGDKGSIRHNFHFKVWYWKSVAKGTSAAGRNSLTRLKDLPWNAVNDWNRLFNTLLVNNSFIIAAVSLPELGYLMFRLLTDADLRAEVTQTPFLSFQLCLVIGFIVVFILTSVPKFSFLGQAERYFEFSQGPLSILTAIALSSLEAGAAAGVFWVLVSLHVIVVTANYLQPHVPELLSNGIEIDDATKEIVEWLNTTSQETRIVVNPVKLAYVFSYLRYSGYLRRDCSFYFRFVYRRGERGYSYFREDISSDTGFEREAFIQTRPREMHRKYGAQLLICENSWLERHLPVRNRDEFLAEITDRLVYRNTRFSVFDIAFDE